MTWLPPWIRQCLQYEVCMYNAKKGNAYGLRMSCCGCSQLVDGQAGTLGYHAGGTASVPAGRQPLLLHLARTAWYLGQLAHELAEWSPLE